MEVNKMHGFYVGTLTPVRSRKETSL